MEKDPLIYIHDILFSINLIEKYIKDISYNEFEDSYDVQDKVLRRLEIIAEAAKKLPETIRTQYNSIPWKSIIGLRNIITHNYDNVNLEEQQFRINRIKSEEMRDELSTAVVGKKSHRV